jgi:hypothetical protein
MTEFEVRGAHQRFADESFNGTWVLLEKEDRIEDTSNRNALLDDLATF